MICQNSIEEILRANSDGKHTQHTSWHHAEIQIAEELCVPKIIFHSDNLVPPLCRKSQMGQNEYIILQN